MRLMTTALCLTAAHAFAQSHQSGNQGLGYLAGSLIEISCNVSTAVTATGSGKGAEATRTDCTLASDCHPAYECSAGRCITRPFVSSPPPPESEPPPPPPPQTSMRRQGSELLVRDRVVELREELALGRGPVISYLARIEGVPPEKLGRALREHRAELLGLIGAADGSAWAGQFLNRVEQLCRPA